MKKNLLKIQKSSSAKIIADCCNSPKEMLVYVHYEYGGTDAGNPNRRNFIGDCGDFVVYETYNDCVMICYNATDNTIIYKRTRGYNDTFPTFMDFGCSMFNMCFSEVYGTYGIRHKTQVTVISDTETVSRTLPYITELFESFRQRSGVLLHTNLYTAVFDNFLYRHIVSDYNNRLYLDGEKDGDTNMLFGTYNLRTTSFSLFITDNNIDGVNPMQLIIPFGDDNAGKNKSTDEIIGSDNKEKEESVSIEQTMQRSVSVSSDDDIILRSVITIGDKLWSEPHYVRAKNFPKIIYDELQKLVACIASFDSDNFVIRVEKISIE